jgi:hypothetical protein
MGAKNFPFQTFIAVNDPILIERERAYIRAQSIPWFGASHAWKFNLSL